jgi:mono/diheme cytochrome c family protein
MHPRTISLIVIAAVVAAVGAMLAFSWNSEIAPLQQQARQNFEPELVSRGADLALIGNCNSCHTKQGGQTFAGGRPMPTPFGTVYGTNITPDPETGIGRWSEEAFRRAMHEGVRRDGAHLYPAFPYDHYTKVSAEDVRAIYAFLMTRESVRAQAPENELTFPFNIRPLIAGWKLLYFSPGEYRPDPSRSADWNRGAYLAEGLAHCGACHTPRNMLGAEERDMQYAGGEIESWHAPALNAASPAPIPWTVEQLSTYLQYGYVEPHGVAAGPMQPVVNNLGPVAEEDVKAIAVYVGSVLAPATAERGKRAEELRQRSEHGIRVSAPAAGGETTGSSGAAEQAGSSSDGASIYAGACAMCHEQSGQRFSAKGIHIAYSKLVALPDPRNLIHVIDDGIAAPDGAPAASMPGFAEAFTEQQVVALVSFLRSRFTDQPAWNNLEDVVRQLRAQKGG